MARQKGIHRLKGTIGEATYYKTRRGYQAREKSGVDGNRIKTDPAFKRTRENFAEFGLTAKAGKLMRSALAPLLANLSKTEAVQKIVRKLTEIKNLDSTSARGEKNVGAALIKPAAKALLKGFNLNSRATLDVILKKAFSVNTATGAINITGFSPINELDYTPGATHVRFTAGWARIDFSKGLKELALSNVVTLKIDAASGNVVLNPAPAPAGSGTDIFLLKVEFLQDEFGVLYPLSNGSYNTLSIVEVG
jgi:hypothetical protein